MGHLLSRVRKKTSVTDTLEQYEKEISSLEEYRRSTEQRQKRLVGSLLLYSVIVYIVLGTALYFYCFPSTVREQCLYAVPLLLFPVIVWILKRLLQKYFKWKIEANSEQLTELLRKRRTILNDVKETETYKKAKEILEKFDPEYKLQEQKKKDAEALLIRPKPLASATELRRRSFPVQSNVSPRTIATSSVPPGMGAPPGFPQNGRQWLRPPPGPPVARPILPRERGVADRFVDYLIGDGPNNRYALICQTCLSHNGMALKEEFEYIAFRCCYCYCPNAARKLRPPAPSLPIALSQPLPHPSQKSGSEDEFQKGELEIETSEPEIETIVEESEPTEKEQELMVEPEEETKEEISEVSETAQTIETTQELLEKEFEPENT